VYDRVQSAVEKYNFQPLSKSLVIKVIGKNIVSAK
jgi:hypothetical protein